MAFYTSNECIYVMTRVFLDMPFFLLLVRYHWCLSKELTQDKKSAFLLIPSFQHKMRSVEKWHLFVVFFVIYSSVFPLFPKNTVLFIWKKCTSDTCLKSFTFNISCCSHHTSSNKWPVAIFRNSLISKSL